jgi:hypothetical protein
MNFSGSRALSDTIEILKQRFGPLLGLSLLLLALQFVATLATGIIAGILVVVIGAASSAFIAVIIQILSNLASFYLRSASSAAMMTMASPITRSPLNEALGTGFRRAHWLILMSLTVILCLVILALPFALVFYAIDISGGRTVAVLLVLAAAMPLLMFLGARLALVEPLIAIDGLHDPIKVITSSWRMTEGAALKIFLVLLAFSAAVLVILLLFFAPVIASLITAASSGHAPNFSGMVGRILLAFLGLLVAAIILPILSAALTTSIHAQLSVGARNSISETFA